MTAYFGKFDSSFQSHLSFADIKEYVHRATPAWQAKPDRDFAAVTADVASLVYLCQPEEDCLTDEDWESSSHK